MTTEMTDLGRDGCSYVLHYVRNQRERERQKCTLHFPMAMKGEKTDLFIYLLPLR